LLSRSDEHDADETATEVAAGYRPEGAVGRWIVSVVDGPEAGVAVTIDAAHPGPSFVGQSPVCELRLSDREASRRHAAFALAEGTLRIRDLGSTNGTFVSGVQIVEALLRGGESIVVGRTTLAAERVASTSVPPPPSPAGFGRVVGTSPAMRCLYPLLERLAQVDIPVLIEGETGTGKELVAEAIHEASPRAQRPYVVFDCTAVPENLVESELFGHERGAFTGAVGTRKGVFEQAHGGTLLIDEIGDLPASLQPKLLRALERSEVRRIGGDRWIKVEVRVLAATRRDLDHEVQERRFRDDLFHRLVVGRVALAPLRERKADIAMLAVHFWRELGGTPPGPPVDLAERWQSEPWPGNVRELRNAVARVVALGSLSAAPMPSFEAAPVARVEEDIVGGVLALGLPFPVARVRILEEFQRRYVALALERHGGNAAEAAQASGIGRRYFDVLRSRSGRRELP
jgi:transcriptional regulator with GAF, ATPase, and Fis domain